MEGLQLQRGIVMQSLGKEEKMMVDDGVSEKGFVVMMKVCFVIEEAGRW